MPNTNKPTNAFVLRQAPCGVSQLDAISLKENVIVNGWAEARGLHKLGEDEYYKCRDIIKQACYPGDKSMRRAGYAAGTMWRFIKGMKVGDWVVVPHSGAVFYLAEITGEACYDDGKGAVTAGSCYRRPVRWLNNKQPIERRLAKSRLASRMRTQQTSAEAVDLINDIADALLSATQLSGGKAPAAKALFRDDLRVKMIKTTLHEIQTGHMNERQFELLVKRVALACGATSAEIVPRLHDKGVDIIATFNLGPVQQTRVGIQVKYYQGDLGVKPIEQLIKGLEEEELSLGWLVTSGTIQESAQAELEKQLAGTNLQIQLVDGELLAGMIVDVGLQQMD